MNTLTKLPQETFTPLRYWDQVSFELVTQHSIRPTIVARRSKTKARKEIASSDARLIVSAHKYEMIHSRVVAIIMSSFIFGLLVVAFFLDGHEAITGSYPVRGFVN